MHKCQTVFTFFFEPTLLGHYDRKQKKNPTKFHNYLERGHPVKDPVVKIGLYKGYFEAIPVGAQVAGINKNSLVKHPSFKWQYPFMGFQKQFRFR